MEAKESLEFKPQRVDSKLSRKYNTRGGGNEENIGADLYSRGKVSEQKKERQRQEASLDKDCTFKPQLSRY